MIDYFQLQFKMFNRKIIDFGTPLLLVYTVLPFGFVLLSNFIFEKTIYANYIYVAAALAIVSKLSAPKRNDFLKSIFSKGHYKKIRMLENVMLCLPFSVFLCYQKQFLFCLILNLCALVIMLFSFSAQLNVTIPTPFGKKPFEYTVGFRNTFFVFPIAYFLTYISVSVGNFNLGVFAMILVGFTCFSFYSKVENNYFVWNYNVSAKAFLKEKTKTCLRYFTFLSLPIIVVLSVFFFSDIYILITFYLLCCAYLTAVVLAKYSFFPSDMSMSQLVLIALSLGFPPLLVVIIPFFYKQSIKKLKAVLND